MEARHRAFHRRQVVTLETEIYATTEMEAWDADDVRAKLERLNEAARKTEEFDGQIINEMIERDDPIEDVDQEQKGIGEYRDRVFKVNTHVKRLFEGPSSSTEAIGTGSVHGSTEEKLPPVKFPKIEMRKFNGKLEEWLPWWAQFRSIHESTALSKVDKFQYLVQSLVDGTRASEVVKVYHCTEQNYDKAIQALKDRCGNEEAITDMLMRELVQLVASRQKLPVTTLYDLLEGKLQSLESIGRKTKSDCEILYPMVEASLSEELLRTWKRVSERIREESEDRGEQLTKLELLMRFLKAEAQREDEIAMTLANVKCTIKGSKRKVEVVEDEDLPTAAGLSTSARVVTDTNKKVAKATCAFCEKAHRSKDCYTAPKMTLEERKRKLIQGKCCFLCFRTNHMSFNCRDKSKCQNCLGKHHILMCPKSQSTSSENSKPKDSQRLGPKPKSSITQCLSNSSSQCLQEVPLQTVRVKIVSPCEEAKIVRAVLDPGAQKSAILKSLAQELNLPMFRRVLLGHNLYSGKQTQMKEHCIHRTEVRSLDEKFSMELNLIDEDSIVLGVPTVSKSEIPIELQLQNILLNDTDTNDEVMLLLGNDVYGKLLTGNVVNTDSGFTAIETKLGWVLSGEKDTGSFKNLSTASMIGTLNIQQLWDLDVIGIRDPIETKSKKELEEDVKTHFLQNLKTNSEGRYEVGLPWITSSNNVPNNRSQAMRRLLVATTKLKSSGYYKTYEEVFMEWMREGIIEEVPEEQNGSARAHYLPHRAVIKNESATTKVRPVFDASCRMAKTLSLNDCLAKGPNLLELIPAILCRFRLRKVGAIADIRKAFLQISVDPQDRDFLRFLWWHPDQETVKIFRHKRVVFGVNCSPFLLNGVIEHHLLRNGSKLALSLLSSFYVDNCVISLNSTEDYEEFKAFATDVMKEAKMDLRLWETNSSVSEGEEASSSVLGLSWNRVRDTLTPSIVKISQPEVVTKRTILSVANGVFDPLGMFAPITLQPKLCLRATVKEGLSWDEPVSTTIERSFRKWIDDLAPLAAISIPRHVAEVNPEDGAWTLHVFTDASQEAYAATAFVRVETKGRVTVRLLQAKTRLAPKNATIPRLELLGCLIGARLASSIIASVDQQWPVTLWSDSTTALTWIRRHDSWGVFVNNRVQEIHRLTKVTDWRFVPGSTNPADLPSRGCSVKKFREIDWYGGPQWLHEAKESWPQEPVSGLNEEDINRERSKKQVSSLSATTRPWYLPRNGFYGNCRIIARMKRWKTAHKGRRSAHLTAEELEAAEKVLFKLAQEECDEEVKKREDILTTNEDGLKCVKLKIALRDDVPAFLMPVFLPSNHPIAHQFILACHLENCHSGPKTTASKIREKVWIPNSKKTVYRSLSKCVVCQRYGGRKNYTQVQPPLPKDRVNDARVFEVTGVDLGGPLYARDRQKIWFCLFTCGVYRAIHLEAVPSLSTEAFVQALRRFIARRGRPRIMYSDRGTNFTGTENLLNQLDWEEIQAFGTERIQWRFNPASAPWWGGWWERLVGLVKSLMKRVYGKNKLNREELETSFCDIEAVVNSRPLTYVSEDPGELMPLTPAMFISDSVNVSVGDLDEVEREQLGKRFRYRQRLREDLRSRFRTEYLANLVQHKNKYGKAQVQVGEVVLLGSDNRKRLQWPLARVVEKIPGRDGICRLVKLKTANGEILRPIQRLFPLEVEEVPRAPSQISETEEDERGNKCNSLPAEPMDESGDDTEDVIINEDANKMAKTTRSGRVVKAPERLSYFLDVLNLFPL